MRASSPHWLTQKNALRLVTVRACMSRRTGGADRSPSPRRTCAPTRTNQLNETWGDYD